MVRLPFMVSPGIDKCKSRQEDVNRLLYIFLAAYSLIIFIYLMANLSHNKFLKNSFKQ